jgi:hypothetical protein
MEFCWNYVRRLESREMQDMVRIFAYSTWVMMISMAMILTSNLFFSQVAAPGWQGWLILLIVGALYLNLIYSGVWRFIRKVPAPTNQYVLVAVFALLPALGWIHFFSAAAEGGEWKLSAVLLLAAGIGLRLGHPAGVKARYEYVQKIKERFAEEG